MATYTENYNLKKPSTTDQVNIEDLNGNADIIDAALAGKADTADVSGKYTKPETGIPATDLSDDVQASLGKADTAVQATEKGATNGVATLDGAGKVPASQLPSYVDDVIEGYYYNGAFYEDSAHTTPITAETGKIYVDLAANSTYRWSGSVYVEISNPIKLDTTLTVQGEAADAKAVGDALGNKVDKISGKGLSTNDYTTVEKNKLGALPTNAELNTSLAGKVDKVTGKGLSTEDYTSAEKTKLGALPTSTELAESLDDKVDKVAGKGLSTEDYTNAEKNKLGALPTNAELQSTLNNKQNALTFDNAPTQNSTNPVTSGGVFAALKDVDNSEEMTIAQYNALSEAKKMDGTVRFITDVSVWPDAAGVGF